MSDDAGGQPAEEARPPPSLLGLRGSSCLVPSGFLRGLILSLLSLLALILATTWWRLPGHRGTQAGTGALRFRSGHSNSNSNSNSSSSSSSGVAGDGRDSRPRVAVCFFGLTRSLRWTLPSIRARVLEALEQEGMRVDTFVHTYSLAEVNNEHAEEREVDYQPFVNDFQALQPTRSLVSNQDDFDLTWPDPLSLTHYNWHYIQPAGVIRNVMRAYWSMALVWELMAEHAAEGEIEYDAVVLARPDVWFHNNVDITSEMFPLPERKVFLPSFDAEDLKGVRRNDRFAYGSVTTMRVVMNRIATLLDAGAGKYFDRQIDSEWVFGHHLLEHQISVQLLDLILSRVRLTRDIPHFDHRLVKEACLSGDDPKACVMMDAGYKFPADDDGAP